MVFTKSKSSLSLTYVDVEKGQVQGIGYLFDVTGNFQTIYP